MSKSYQLLSVAGFGYRSYAEAVAELAAQGAVLWVKHEQGSRDTVVRSLSELAPKANKQETSCDAEVLRAVQGEAVTDSDKFGSVFLSPPQPQTPVLDLSRFSPVPDDLAKMIEKQEKGREG
jgi:hypothetical protein